MCTNDECNTLTPNETLYVRLDEAGVAVWLRSRRGWSYRLPNGAGERHGFATKVDAAFAAWVAITPKVSA